MMPGLKERAKTLVELMDGARFLFAQRPLALDEKAAGLLPVADLAVELQVQADESRLATLTARTPTGAALLQGLREVQA
jgi:hypothetical protein